jgi:hypothetical protein
LKNGAQKGGGDSRCDGRAKELIRDRKRVVFVLTGLFVAML